MCCSCCKWCPIIAFVFAIVATLGIFYSLFIPDWKHEWGYNSENQYYATYEGLWVACIKHESHGLLCDSMGWSLLSLPVDVQAIRIMAALSSGFAVIGLIVGIFGLNCAKIVKEDTRRKCTGRSGSFFMLLAGILCSISVTWYAYNVMNEYHSNSYPSIGTGIYVGWAASGLALLAGFMSCCNCTSSPETPEKNGYMPLPQQPESLPQQTPKFINAFASANSQIYPYDNSTLLASNGVGLTSYKPAFQTCTNIMAPTPSFSGTALTVHRPSPPHAYMGHHA